MTNLFFMEEQLKNSTKVSLCWFFCDEECAASHFFYDQCRRYWCSIWVSVWVSMRALLSGSIGIWEFPKIKKEYPKYLQQIFFLFTLRPSEDWLQAWAFFWQHTKVMVENAEKLWWNYTVNPNNNGNQLLKKD